MPDPTTHCAFQSVFNGLSPRSLCNAGYLRACPRRSGTLRHPLKTLFRPLLDTACCWVPLVLWVGRLRLKLQFGARSAAQQPIGWVRGVGAPATGQNGTATLVLHRAAQHDHAWGGPRPDILLVDKTADGGGKVNHGAAGAISILLTCGRRRNRPPPLKRGNGCSYGRFSAPKISSFSKGNLFVCSRPPQATPPSRKISALLASITLYFTYVCLKPGRHSHLYMAYT